MSRPEITRWDVARTKKKGTPTSAPKCSSCGAPSVFDPCRTCEPAPTAATPPEVAPGLFDEGAS